MLCISMLGYSIVCYGMLMVVYKIQKTGYVFGHGGPLVDDGDDDDDDDDDDDGESICTHMQGYEHKPKRKKKCVDVVKFPLRVQSSRNNETKAG